MPLNPNQPTLGVLLLLFLFNGYFFRWTSSHFRSGPPPVPEQNLHGLVEWGFLWARCPSCHPAVVVKAQKGTQSTNPNRALASSFLRHHWTRDRRCLAAFIPALTQVPELLSWSLTSVSSTNMAISSASDYLRNEDIVHHILTIIATNHQLICLPSKWPVVVSNVIWMTSFIFQFSAFDAGWQTGRNTACIILLQKSWQFFLWETHPDLD